MSTARRARIVLANLCEETYGYGPGASEYLRAQLLAKPDLAERLDVHVLFLTGTDPTAFAERIAALEPDLVGFTCYSWNLAATARTARELRRLAPGALLVWGGCSFALFRERNDWFAWWDAADAVAVGSGETTIVDLARHVLEHGPRLEAPLRGLAVARDGKVELGAPALTPRTLAEVESPYQRGTVYQVARPYIEMARGCRFECTFCSDARTSRDGVWLSQTPERVAADVAAVVKWPVAEWVDAGASTANVTEEHFRDVCEGIRRGDPGSRLFYSFQMYPAIVRPTQREALAGIRIGKICMGLQSSSPETWGPMRRRSTIDHLKRSVSILSGVGPIFVTTILGLPGETVESFTRMLDEVLAIDGLNVSVHRLLVLPGTQLHRDHEKYGLGFDFERYFRADRSSRMTPADFVRAQEVVLDRAARLPKVGRPRLDWTNFDVQARAFDSPTYVQHAR